MTIQYKDIKDKIKINIATGKAVIPSMEWDDIKIRDPDMNDYNDYFAVSDLVRRMKTIEAMNTVIKYANNEDISMGCWLYEVDDGSKGLDFYDYVDDETYFTVVKLFIDIIKEDVKDVNDLAY